MPKFKIYIETIYDSKIGPEDIADVIIENFVEVIDIELIEDENEDDGKDHFLN